MVRKTSFILLFFAFLVMDIKMMCQTTGTSSFSMNTRQSYYSTEKKYEMILHIPYSLSGTSLNITLKVDNNKLTAWQGVPKSRIITIPIEAELPPSHYKVTAEIVSATRKKYNTDAILTILEPKRNEVKTDNLTGALIVDGRIYFPFGFYCYSPVFPTLPEEEIVKGFNMISPYQKILPGTIGERKSYMDRCAQLGMKVHYNLLSFSGAGTAAEVLKNLSAEERKKLLISEVKTFMNHPALLAWYIADEPNGYKTPPEELEEVYRIIKETDPWHPVSMVFMAPFLSSRKYADAFDVVIADPYPVPNRSVTQVGDVTDQLRTEFDGKKPLWIVPQAFGGSEWWGREPSVQEIRSMTYQAIVEGARGIQYFIRHGLNSFPKSTAMWNECGRMALEVAEITPWLLSDEKPLDVTCDSKSILVTSALHDDRLMIIAVNTINSPVRTNIRIKGVSGALVKVLFENRSLTLSSGSFSDYLPSFGSQVYLIKTGNPENQVSPYLKNLIKDPGFEDVFSPGVPSSCYAWNEGDRGSTFFLDTREHCEGDHSIRLVTPRDNAGTRLRFFPVNVSKGKKYILTIRAKADPVSSDPMKHESDFPSFEIGLGDYGNEKFKPGKGWQQFVTSVTIPADSVPTNRVNAILRMPDTGVAWFDMLQVFEAVDIRRSINPELINYVYDE
jgi:hypothetical protein